MSRYRQSARAEIQRLKRQLETLFLRVEGLEEQDEISGDLHRYLCVRVSGFLEQALVAAARSLCESRSGAHGLRFALSWLERAPNPRADEIIKLVARFDASWADQLRTLFSDDERGTRVNSLLGIRNDIAHGKNQGVTRRQAWEYFKLTEEIVEWILERFEPSVPAQ
jgi:hypothetical protein